MLQKISFNCYSNIKDIKEEWTELDKKAEELKIRYAEYTYYQTYEWNEFLFRHIKKGFGKLTTAMRYYLIKIDGKPFSIIPTQVTRISKKVRIPSCRVGGY